MPVIIEDGIGSSARSRMSASGGLATGGGGGGGGGTSGWDVNAAETLFWEAVPIRLKLGGQDDRVRNLSFRIMLWDNSIKGVPKTLGVTLTSEENRFFLYTMEVSEEDFAALRQDQGILVDFGSFPSEMISLLQSCISSGDEPGPRFQAVLDASDGDASFSIVETNKFKHLTHISLIFRLGTDTTVKQYLSSRLQEVGGDARRLRQENEAQQQRLEELEQRVSSLTEVTSSGKQQHDRALNEVTARYERELIEERNRRVQDLADANERAVSEAAEAASKAAAEREALLKRASELEEEGRVLRDQKYALDARVSQLSAQHGSASGELEALRAECERLKAANLEAAKGSHELEKGLSDAQIELAGLKSKVTDKESLNVTNSGRLAELEKTKGMLEVSLEEHREQLRASEQRFREQKAETEKGIQIIDRLQNDMAAGKARMKTLKTMLHNQESQKRAGEEAHERLRAEHEALKLEVAAKQQTIDALKSTVEDQKAKLGEAYQQIDSNRKFISYLNSQCNQAQLGGGGGGYGGASSRSGLSSSALALPPSSSALPHHQYHHQGSVGGTTTATAAAAAPRQRYGGGSASGASTPGSMGYHGAGGLGEAGSYGGRGGGGAAGAAGGGGGSDFPSSAAPGADGYRAPRTTSTDPPPYKPPSAFTYKPPQTSTNGAY